VFSSQSFSAIAIIKAVVVKEAALRSIALNFSLSMNENSIKTCLEVLKPKFEYFQKTINDYNMIPALKELQIQVLSMQAINNKKRREI